MAKKKKQKKPSKPAPAKPARAPAVEHQEPPIQTQDPPLETRDSPAGEDPEDPKAELTELCRQRDILRGQAVTPFSKKKLELVDRRIDELEKVVGAMEPSWHFWPEDQPMPEVHVKMTHKPTPCPNCKRRYLPTGGQAVTCKQSTSVEARFRCMHCKTTFALPVRVVKV